MGKELRFEYILFLPANDNCYRVNILNKSLHGVTWYCRPESVIQWWSTKYHLDRNLHLFKDPIHAGKRLDFVVRMFLCIISRFCSFLAVGAQKNSAFVFVSCL